MPAAVRRWALGLPSLLRGLGSAARSAGEASTSESTIARGAASRASLWSFAGRLDGAPRDSRPAWPGVRGFAGCASSSVSTFPSFFGGWGGMGSWARSFAKNAVAGEAGLKRYRPVTPGLRHRVITRRSDLHKGPPVRALTEAKKRIDGRNNHGKRTRRHRGGGHKRRYRVIDMGRAVRGTQGTVQRIEYDPNRTARIALVKYDSLAEQGEQTGQRDFADGLRYIIATEDMAPGIEVAAGPDAPVKTGCALPLASIPVGTFVHNVELYPGRGGKLVRAAGTQAQLIGRADDKYSIVRLPSGEVRKIHSGCYASVGRVGNVLHNNVKLGKAGAKRWLGRKPRVCGVNMNAVDHPHGGGKARHGPGRPNVSKYGVLAKGGKTRNPRKPSNAFIITSRREARA